MTFTQFAAQYPDEFRRALARLDSERIAALLDRGSAMNEIGAIVWNEVDTAKHDLETQRSAPLAPPFDSVFSRRQAD